MVDSTRSLRNFKNYSKMAGLRNAIIVRARKKFGLWSIAATAKKGDYIQLLRPMPNSGVFEKHIEQRCFIVCSTKEKSALVTINNNLVWIPYMNYRVAQ